MFYGCPASTVSGLFFSHSLSRSLLRDYADSSAVDQYLSCTLDQSCVPGARCQAYSLSSSGCSQLQLLAPPSFGSRNPSLASTRARWPNRRGHQKDYDMREQSKSNKATFALTADVTEAHRQVPISRQDWHLLGCQLQLGCDVFVNTVGTFGVASASYCWSRVASAVGRQCQYNHRPLASTWHLLVADVYHLDAGGPEYRAAIICFFVLCSVLGVPLSWRKTAGGDTVSWVGFELLHRSYKIGLSERRAQWFHRWTRETAESGCVHMSAFEEGLGRVMYVAAALEFERPFLSSLYRFLTLHPRDSVRRLPGYVVFVLQYFADRIQESRHYDCAAELISSDVAPRVDAQACDGRTGETGPVQITMVQCGKRSSQLLMGFQPR